jgi:hypothetical protein
MNALIKKEIRLLLPAWIAAMLLAIFAVWIIPAWSELPTNDLLPANTSSIYAAIGLASTLGFLFLGVASFGQEFSFGTFSFLLSQPIPRRRVWLIKTVMLVIAFVSVISALIISVEVHYYYFHRTFFIPLAEPIGITLVLAYVIFSGGLWTTLLLRQMTGAFWFTLLTPAVIVISLFELVDYFHLPFQSQILTGVVLLYSIAGFFWARRMFLRAQDAQWTGGEISFRWRKKVSERTAASFSSRPRHWLSVLVRKEFQLHQVTILIAVIVLALHLASVFIRKFHPNFDNPNVKGMLELVWALWLLMPLLVGCAAVAEERRLGLIESQLCLPVSRRAQLFIKFSVALVLSLILGALMPLLFERTKDFNSRIFVPAAALFFISFYASTLARTTLQAIGLTIVVSVVFYFCQVATAINTLKFGYSPERLGLELLNLFLGYPILLLVLAWLTIWNFKWLHENWKLWRRNFIMVLASFAFIFVLTHAIYFRAWELLTPVEPPHGPTRLHEATPVKFVGDGNTIYATLPDGRMWVETLAFNDNSDNWRSSFEALAPSRNKAQFIGGSNWVGAAADNFQTLGIQSDGSLWNLQKNPFEKQSDFKLTQIGSETNWLQAAGNPMGFLLLKKDGSLWTWGIKPFDWKTETTSLPKKLKFDLATPPARISEETNWTEVFTSGTRWQKISDATKNDGSVWGLSLDWEKTNSVAHLQSTNMNSGWRDFVSSGSGDGAVVKTNGELWHFWSQWSRNEFIPQGKIQLGQNAKWKAVTFTAWDRIVAIRSDGTLWKWPPSWALINYPDSVKPVQLGNHSDWIAFPSINNWHAIALAADGSLWAWAEPGEHVWLAPSRKPVLIGNIFQGAEAKTK